MKHGECMFLRKWVWLLLVLSSLMLFLAWPGAVRAQTKLAMRADVGFQTFYDPRVWVPVRVTITQQAPGSIRGELAFSIAGPNRFPYEGKLLWPVRIQAGTSSVIIGLPGKFLRTGGAINLLVDGRMVASARVSGVAVSSSDLAGIVSDHPEAVQFLAGVTSANSTAQVVAAYIQPAALPPSSQLLQGLTYLYIDGSAAAELSGAQVRALEQWVRSGGILVLGGVQPNAGQTTALTSISPVAGTIVVDGQGNALAAFAGTQPLRGVVPQLFGVAARDTTVLIGSRTAALLGVRPLGRGEVAYLGLQSDSSTLVSWSGNALFWDAVLKDLHSSVLTAKPDLFGSSGLWSFMNAAELFPQLHMPPLWIWELVFTVYTVACGPLLYMWLRRRRKHEWAWLVLPLVSIGLAGAIYVQGVLQRPNGILTQSVGLIDIVDPNLAQAVGVEALMSPQTRSYSVTLPPSTWVVPLSERVSGAARDDGNVWFGTTGSTVTFTHVRAWGGRFVYATHGLKRFGEIAGQLFAGNGSLGGFLVNDSTVDFSDLALVTRGQVISLGRLRKGASVNVNVLFKKGGRASLDGQLGVALTSASHGVGRALFDFASAFAKVPAPLGTVLLIGWTHDEPNLFRTRGPIFPATPQWLVRELIPVTPVVE